MKKLLTAGVASLAMLVFAVPAFAAGIRVNDPTGAFGDAQGNQGFVEVTDEPAVRACNENEATPAGDDLTGYVWINPDGEPTTPTYGNENVGAGDADGEGVDDGDDTNGTEGDDCPDAADGTEVISVP